MPGKRGRERERRGRLRWFSFYVEFLPSAGQCSCDMGVTAVMYQSCYKGLLKVMAT